MRLLTSSPRDIEQAIREPKDEPLRLKSYASADLPPASEWGFGLLYDGDAATVKFSDGSSWRQFQPLDGDLTAIAALTTTSFVCPAFPEPPAELMEPPAKIDFLTRMR